MDDEQLEQAMRTGLRGRSEAATVDPLVVARARRDARRRRTTRVAVLGAAAAVVAVAGVGVTSLDRDGGPAPSTSDLTGPSASSPAAPPPADLDDAAPLTGAFRVEYWRGVRVDVPADWGYGNPVLCGDVPTGEPYVGRPIGLTDMCTDIDTTSTPTAPYVWFDVEGVAVGTVDLGDGWTRETVEVAGSRVGVATRDPALRASILATVAPGDLCEPTLAASPEARYDNTFEGAGGFVDGRLCAYAQGEDGTYGLQYARLLDRGDFEDTQTAVDQAPATTPCRRASYEVVVLTAGYEDPYGPRDEVALERDLVYDLECGVVRVGEPFGSATSAHRVTEATVPWAGPEFRRLLTGPPEPWSYERFIGVQG